MEQTAETFADRLLVFTIPDRDARGRMVRLDGVLKEILSAHDYPAPVTHVLSEALVLGALMGGLLKTENGQLTMQAQTQNGPVRLLVCDYKSGEMRGYADFDAEAVSKLGANPGLAALFGEGFLAITFDTGNDHRYQGIVPLEGSSLGEACEAYFVQSEQIPTYIKVASRISDGQCEAAGVLVQHLADGEEGRERLHVRLDHPDWEHVATMTGSLTHDELLDRDLSMEAIVWRLFHEEKEVRIRQGKSLSRGCRCSKQYYETVIARFPADEIQDMRDEAGDIKVDCAFCSKQFVLEN